MNRARAVLTGGVVLGLIAVAVISLMTATRIESEVALGLLIGVASTATGGLVTGLLKLFERL